MDETALVEGPKRRGRKKGSKNRPGLKARNVLAAALVRPVLVDQGSRRRGSAPTRAGKQRMMVVAALFHAGFTYREITDQTGLSTTQIRSDVALANKHYKLSERLSGVLTRLDAEAVPLAVDHLVKTLESADAADNGRKDVMATEVLSGRGLFRSHRALEEHDRAPAAMAFQVNFTTGPGVTTGSAPVQIVGVRRAVPESSAASVLSQSRREEGRVEPRGCVTVGRGEPGPASARARETLPADFAD